MLRSIVFFCLAGITSGLFWGLVGRDQAVAVTGKFTCNGRPAPNIRVKLYEKEATLDVKMAEGSSDSDGSFRLNGHKVEVTTIDPKVNIYHKCNYEGMCYKKVSINIPDSFITEGTEAERVFDIGTINLAGGFSGQSTDCIN